MRQKAAADRLRVCPGRLMCLKSPKSVPGGLGLRVNLPAAELRTQGYQGREALTVQSDRAPDHPIDRCASGTRTPPNSEAPSNGHAIVIGLNQIVRLPKRSEPLIERDWT